MSISEQLAVALVERIADSDILDVLVQHVEASGSIDDAIADFDGAGDRVLFLPGRKKAKASDLARELKTWRPKLTSGDVVVYHSTTRSSAEFMLKNGVIPQMKPWTMASRRYAAGEYAEFRPGAGVERGIYVGTSKSTSGFGPVTLALKVPRSWLKVPAELTSLGYSDVGGAMETEHGAIIKEPIHPKMIKRA